ncbi:MAG: ribonuclease R [Firmicutes bacterium]|nr:ribonuclease R [Bacillota bacterium]
MENLFEKRKKLICELTEDPRYVPMKEKELAIFMQVKPEDRRELTRTLEELLAEGKLEQTRRGRYVKPEKKLCRAVGVYQSSENFGFVIPDNRKTVPDIFIAKEKRNGAFDGAKVVVEYEESREERKSPEGEIIEVLGAQDAPGVDMLSVVRALGIPEDFSEKVLNQAQRVAAAVSEGDCAGRRDLRSLYMVTIDGEDAKDLDDAVSLTAENGVWRLGVHIADVANYVQENSALDWAAKERGTSVYLADRVIPMLPRTLSNGICSLNAGEDRLALSCLMDIDEKGNIGSYEIVESVICVNRRMSYSEVQKVLDGDETAREGCMEAVPMLEEMARLSQALRKKRRERGAVDFDFPESKIRLDAEGNPVEIVPYERNDATKLIEDFMLAANETVAQHFYWLELPFLYRVHDTPDGDRMKELAVFLQNFGYRLHLGGSGKKKGGKGKGGISAQDVQVHPKQLQKLLDQIEGTPEEAMLARLILRSMRRAFYSPECTGHFGLAASCYCHFTSPIRRYPDLQIHRIIKEFLRGRLNGGRTEHYADILDGVARQSSETERRADEAERICEKIKKAQYMEAHVGEVFEGVISGVTGWGLYAELPNTVEGLIPIGSMTEDYFIYDEANCRLVGDRTGIFYQLGESVTVEVTGANRYAGTVDFRLVRKEDDGEDGTETGSEQ